MSAYATTRIRRLAISAYLNGQRATRREVQESSQMKEKVGAGEKSRTFTALQPADFERDEEVLLDIPNCFLMTLTRVLGNATA